ncbi:MULTISPECIES: hypothetical protein [Bradyrhizobium]|uniref:hypothetical protein n=1 Tax=Bradyrhizobium TaxID=374 RepID=UPI0011412844|nr:MULTISPECIES: hypothetical protein [Bradyrhizobium]QOG22522.1 hypothetical protein FOM02_39830 [Bradyrhizobium sp. SEMIA]UFW45939.1 hypothetical protein BaraCB756_26900 [Bradyrhizobium arachidis]
MTRPHTQPKADLPVYVLEVATEDGKLGLALLTLAVGIIAIFTALAFLLLRTPIPTDSLTGEQALAPVEANPATHKACGAGTTLIAAAGIGILWFFIWKLIAIALQYLFVSGTSSRAFPVVPLSFAISIATMCVVVLLVRRASRW